MWAIFLKFFLICYRLYQDGTIGSELVIRPLPERVLQEVVDEAPALYEPELLPNVTRNENFKRTSHHIVFKKINRPVDDEYNDFCEYIICYRNSYIDSIWILWKVYKLIFTLDWIVKKIL